MLEAPPVPVSVIEHCVPAGIPVIGSGPPEVNAPVESNVNVLGDPLNAVPDAGHATTTVNVAPDGGVPDTTCATVKLPAAVPPPRPSGMAGWGFPSLTAPVPNAAGDASRRAPPCPPTSD